MYVEKMATNVISGGLSALNYLGCVDTEGEIHYETDRQWAVADNGNPENILEITRGVLGENDTLMFIIERDFNRNVCYYKANTDAGGREQVLPNWLIIPRDIDMHNLSIEEVEDELKEENLTMVETYAYGTKNIDTNQFMVNALKGEQLSIFKDDEGNYRASIFIRGTPWVLNRIMIHTKSVAMGLYPAVSEIHLDVETLGGTPAQFFYAH